MKLQSVILGMCLVAMATPTWAITRHVPSADYPTIQAGIDAAYDPIDDVEIADGTYSGPGNQDINFRGKGITVHSQNGPDVCIIDGGGFGANHRGFVFNTSETSASVLEGVTITHAVVTWENGGAIFIDAASPTIRNCRLMGNGANAFYGGGIYCNNSSAQIIDCLITGNAAGGYHGMGGGGGIYAENSNLTIEGCTVAGNMSGGPHAGGLVMSNASISRTIVWGNCGGPYSEYQGSGVLTCCDVNVAGFPPGFQFNGPQVYTNPLFCDPRPCYYEAGGDYRLQAGSPCLPQYSPCSELIGALGQGCGAVPVEQMTWGRVKAHFR